MRRSIRFIPWSAFFATFALVFWPDHRSSPVALWPSVVAVGLALLTRDIYLSLFLGALSGAILLRDGNAAQAFIDLFSRYLLPALSDRWNMSVLVFTLLLGGMVHVMAWSGGTTAMARLFLGSSRSPRRAMFGAFGLGLAVFFDGLANAMLVGKTMRPLAARAGVSPEKLSFIVDSTSSPIAGLALISTWVAYEMSVIREGLAHIGGLEDISAFSLLVASLPFRYYNYFILAVVFFVVWLGRDFGPMLAAERATTRDKKTREPPAAAVWGRIWLAVIPLGLLILAVPVGLYIDGGAADRPISWLSFAEAFGKADAARVFVLATAGAATVAMLLACWFRPAGDSRPVTAVFFDGMSAMFLPALILVFAWVLNAVIKEMGTATYLVSLLGESLPAAVLPAAVFLLAALVSFSTGTSWGTMAIVMPLSIPLAAHLTGMEATGPVFLATIAAVLSGAVFGDHCSPISDTTIVSAFSSDCGVIEHVRTQLPYAAAAAGIALAAGFSLTGLVHPVWPLILGLTACWVCVRFVGRSSQAA